MHSVRLLFHLVSYLVFCVGTIAFAADAALVVADPRCEGLLEPQQIDEAAPRFSWRMESDLRNVQQVAFQLRIRELDVAAPTGGDRLESPRIENDKTQWVTFPGFKPEPRRNYAWQVRAWDNHGNMSDWCAEQRFGTGLLDGKWPADWIGDGRVVAESQTMPARYFRNTFKLENEPVRARLFISAFGLVEPWINGRQVTEDRFVPGWPDYRHRVFYVSYDVTHLLQPGENAWGAILGDGWYSGTILPLHQYGSEPSFLHLSM